jgi:hypothetical protein
MERKKKRKRTMKRKKKRKRMMKRKRKMKRVVVALWLAVLQMAM